MKAIIYALTYILLFLLTLTNSETVKVITIIISSIIIFDIVKEELKEWRK